jgi:hypothetical protein
MPAQQGMMLPGPISDSSRISCANSPFLAAQGGEEGDISILCDPRLHDLEIGFWTLVPIGNVLAARAISLYLKTDHPLLGLFEPTLFISDLVDKRNGFCSPAIVNALLYWACVSLEPGSSFPAI